MRSKPVKGTRDFLPREAALREYMQQTIIKAYKSAGFSQIITPILEDIRNLRSSEGGDNLNLMFHILKRGDKLNAAIANEQFGDLADIGLRYDLTLPLSRYFANNSAALLLPMKCIQIGNAYRAESPQKGRYREFTQCDIDILGQASIWAEIELIITTASALASLGIGDFRVRISDRRILERLFVQLGFEPAQTPALCIIFDKLEKIGIDGIKNELLAGEFDQGACTKLLDYLQTGDRSLAGYTALVGESEYTNNIETIIQAVSKAACGQYACEFDISLVRGQGYYTGTVFEVESLQYAGSLAGGGRYDNLIGKFLGQVVPAVGFSIGFERIFDLLLAQGFVPPGERETLALFFSSDYLAAHQAALSLRGEYNVSILEKPKKLGKLLGRLQEAGYVGFAIAEEGAAITRFAP